MRIELEGSVDDPVGEDNEEFEGYRTDVSTLNMSIIPSICESSICNWTVENSTVLSEGSILGNSTREVHGYSEHGEAMIECLINAVNNMMLVDVSNLELIEDIDYEEPLKNKRSSEYFCTSKDMFSEESETKFLKNTNSESEIKYIENEINEMKISPRKATNEDDSDWKKNLKTTIYKRFIPHKPLSPLSLKNWNRYGYMKGGNGDMHGNKHDPCSVWWSNGAGNMANSGARLTEEHHADKEGGRFDSDAECKKSRVSTDMLISPQRIKVNENSTELRRSGRLKRSLLADEGSNNSVFSRPDRAFGSKYIGTSRQKIRKKRKETDIYSVSSADIHKYVISKNKYKSKCNSRILCNSLKKSILGGKCAPESRFNKLVDVLEGCGIVKNLLELYLFVMDYTPFEFQRKILPLKGYFNCSKPIFNAGVSDSLLISCKKNTNNTKRKIK